MRIFFVCLVALMPWLATGAVPSSEVESLWPGVKFEIIQMVRIDASHLLMAVRVKADRGLAQSVRLAERAALPIPEGTSEDEIASGKYDAIPFTLTQTILVDEVTGKKYPALTSLPAQPFFGPNTLLATLKRGSSIELGIYMQAPEPLPLQDGKPPEQKVTVLFPKAAKPLKGVVLPAEIQKSAP